MNAKRARVLEAVKSSTEIVGPTLIFDISDALEIAHGSTDMLPRALEVIGPKLSVLLNRPLSEDTIKDAAKIITDSILGLETISAASRQINELRRKLADRDDTIANLDRKIEDATKSFETITSDLVSAQERARARELERDQLEARNAELETENAKLREKLDVFQSPESYPNHAFDNVEDHRDYLAHWNAQLGDQLQKTKDQVAVEKAEIRAVKATAEMDKKFQIENFERASRRVRELQIKLVNMDLERALIKTSRRDIEDNAVEKLRNIRNAVEALVSDGQIKTWHASKILDLF